MVTCYRVLKQMNQGDVTTFNTAWSPSQLCSVATYPIRSGCSGFDTPCSITFLLLFSVASREQSWLPLSFGSVAGCYQLHDCIQGNQVGSQGSPNMISPPRINKSSISHGALLFFCITAYLQSLSRGITPLSRYQLILSSPP